MQRIHPRGRVFWRGPPGTWAAGTEPTTLGEAGTARVELTHLTKGQPLIVIQDGDDVATALRDLAPAERLPYLTSGTTAEVEILEPIPFGHKVALRSLPQGAEVHKYGAVIGRLTSAVRVGALVHVHNLSGVRGRGDLAGGAAKGAVTDALEG